MLEVRFRDYFNDDNVYVLGYGIIGCFFMWLFGTCDREAQANIINAARRRMVSQ